MRLIFAILTFIPLGLFSQENDFMSIHQEQSDYYARFTGKDAIFFDSLNGFRGKTEIPLDDSCQLDKLVFGFHPYWMGSSYLNYQWNLLSDLCYFSYEVDPATGHPQTIHDWLTDPSVDSAQAHGVRTHLCATLFSGHYTFFGSATARQNLIDNLVSLVQQRDADGINIDFEAVPASLGPDLTAFMIELSSQFHTAIPHSILSIDLPAVDWGDVFDIVALRDYVDLFMVMGYDYYWNGSGTAGPVGPLYPMTDVYNYGLCRTISSYQAAGLPNEKFILGLPYYGRLWKTLSGTVPSGTIGYGTALTYANVRNNAGGNFSPVNFYWEGNSFSSAFIYYENSDWHQCFIGLERDVKKRYDMVKYRGLSGIGIWALGYDNGYTELWDAIRSRLTDCAEQLVADTIYDCGGPAWDYYNHENYWYRILPVTEGLHYLDFRSFSTEAGFDSLWIYSGPDSLLTFLGGFSGTDEPPMFSSDNGAFSLHFSSDGLTTASGWEAIWHDGTLGIPVRWGHTGISVAPNPFREYFTLNISGCNTNDIKLECTDMLGRKVPLIIQALEQVGTEAVKLRVKIQVADNISPTSYLLRVWRGSGYPGTVQVISIP